jgi:hypothetical protein
VAYTPAFIDTGAHYTLSAAISQGKWTSGTTAPTAITIAEDGLQGMRGGAMTKVITGAAGGIIVSRWAGAVNTGLSCIFKMAGTLSQSFKLNYNENTNRLVLTTPDAVAHTSVQFSIQNGLFYTTEFAYLYNGTNFIYALYLTEPSGSPTLINDVGSSIVTASVPSMTDLSINDGATLGMDQRSFIACKQYSGSGGQWSVGDLYGNVSRGLLYPNSDGRWPATTPLRTWTPSTGSSYFGVLDETLASTTDYITEATDVNSAPNGSPDFLDRASWSFTDSPASVLSVPHVQFNNLVQMLNGTATYKLLLKNNVADDTAVSITPLTAPAAWAWRLDSYGTDPRNGNVAWTKALLDSIEVGIEPINFS